jgi:hypothetical protein
MKLSTLHLSSDMVNAIRLNKDVHTPTRNLMFTVVKDEPTEEGHEGRTVSRSEITCFRCGENGHKKQECRVWKTRMCTIENCTGQCMFAHSKEELRMPWVSKCIRVVRIDGKLQKIGCGCIGHTFRECKHNIDTDNRNGRRYGRNSNVRRRPPPVW